MAHSMRVRRVGLLALALSSVFLLSACNPSGDAAEDFPGVPGASEAEAVDVEAGDDPAGDEEETESSADGPVVVWWADGGQIALTISGSSTCPVVGEQIRVLEKAGEGNRVAIDLVQRPEDQVCTMDLVPHTTLFWTPVTVTTTEPLVVEVAGYEIEVPIK
ncbi:hypothetical protein [Agromyces badenianii]|uniref:hypothetical protein n=1 Tax=Agromyces badenianii TaxID=2080742 RepID=UPI00105A1174|nr:hypothetical protein [Agromyces badenianii]